MKECFIAVMRDHKNGTNAVAYLDREMAMKEVLEDVIAILDYLDRKGYEAVTYADNRGNHNVSVPNSEIFYEWSIIESNVVTEKEIW